MRPELLPFLKLTEAERLREEDPFTGEWVRIADNQLRVSASRFEFDINRPREKAVYLQPRDAWGLQVWNSPLPERIVEKSLQFYDEIYAQTAAYFDALLTRHDYLIIYDLHTYNHRREGFDTYAAAKENPEVNIGTANLNHNVWEEVIKTLLDTMRTYNFEGRHLSVGENVKFSGGYFGQWLYSRYQDQVCPISIEVKKFFMDEWTGEVFEPQLRHVREFLISTIRPVIQVRPALTLAGQ